MIVTPAMNGTGRARFWCTAIAVALALGVTSSAEAAESIVGRWAFPGACGNPDESLTISAMKIDGMLSCSFSAVERAGNTVRWAGICYGPEGDKRDGGMEARLKGKQLTLEGSGLQLGPLQRCRAK